MPPNEERAPQVKKSAHPFYDNNAEQNRGPHHAPVATMHSDKSIGTSRRHFLSRGALYLASATGLLANTPAKPVLRIGLLTDLHYADKPPRGSRHYRDTLGKLAECVERFNQSQIDFVVELGDLIDKAPSAEVEIHWLREVNTAIRKANAPVHYILGNHCVSSLTKEEFIHHSGCNPQTYSSFDQGPFHFVLLDACFTSDGTPYGRDNFDWKDASIPPQEIAWLQRDLASTDKPVLIFAHQRLDPHGAHTIRNAAAIREILERSGKVTAVFQGHSHANDYAFINGIHYCTLVAMVEGQAPEQSGYGTLEIFSDQSLRLTGFRKQTNLDLDRHP
ncbi:MAG: hypothetical protein RIS92_668 [Verrucomicrobiota bacterium]